MSGDVCITFLDENTVSINSISEKNTYKFAFDRAFDYNTTQNQIYEYAAKNIVNCVLEGFNGTIFAYGQTSSGKTFTMQGVLDDMELEGIIPRITRYIFYKISELENDSIEFIIKASLIEIYNEKIKDLIEPQKSNLQVREDKTKGIYIEDLSEHQVNSSNSILNLIKKGLDNRAIQSTNMNEQSSRSHSIVILNITQNNLKDLSAKSGKLYLVDLAGSEKISKTGATGTVLDEAKAINKSLTTLGLVIKALTESKQGHIPYRESKLTRVLQESLGGNSKTCLIITCSPSFFNEAETLSTLRFGLRAKKVKNKAKVNKEYSIQELKIEVGKLEGQLGKFKNRVGLLEEYLMKHGLPLPSEEGLSVINVKVDKINDAGLPNYDINMNVEKKSSTEKEDNEIQREETTKIIEQNNIKDDIIISQAEITKSDECKQFQEEIPLDKNEIIQINNKYIEVLDIVNDLELEKIQLESQLKKAAERMNEFNIEKERKEVLLKELEDMKHKSDKKAEEMEKEMSRMMKHYKKNKHNLSLISEANIDLEICPDTIIEKEENLIFLRNNNEYNSNPKTNFIDIESKPEICIEIPGHKQNSDLISYKCNISKSENVQSMQSTQPFSAGLNDIQNNSTKINKNTPDIILNITNLFANQQQYENNSEIEDLFDKLNEYSDKYPELNNLIETYKDKILYTKEKTRTKSNYSKRNYSPNNEDEDVILNKVSNRRKTQVEKNAYLRDLEAKVEKLFENRIKERDFTKLAVNNQNFCDWNLKCWKEKYKNFSFVEKKKKENK